VPPRLAGVAKRRVGPTPTRARTARLPGDRAAGGEQEQRGHQGGAPGASAVDEGGDQEPTWTPPEWTELSGEGEPSESVVEGRTITIKGQTHGHLDGGHFTTVDTLSKGSGCKGCRPKDGCTTVSGTVESDFTATFDVTLPTVPGDLTPCQKAIVQDAIDNRIAPHEQQHVQAFTTYSGHTSIPFSVTSCKSKLRAQANAQVSAIHRAENKRREDAAKTASNALDPFVVTLDLDCKEPDAGGP
jgi:hypothetical protein